MLLATLYGGHCRCPDEDEVLVLLHKGGRGRCPCPVTQKEDADGVLVLLHKSGVC